MSPSDVMRGIPNPDPLVSKQFHILHSQNVRLKEIAKDQGITLTALLHRMVDKTIADHQ